MRRAGRARPPPARAPAVAAGDPTPWQPRGTVLVTGGTGALGAHVARWLAGTGAEHLVLVSRRGAGTPGAAELLAELAGARRRRHRSPPATSPTADALADLLAEPPGARRCTAVVHAAGVGDVGAAGRHRPGRPRRRASPRRCAGAGAARRAARRRELDAFVLFSSIAGGVGQRRARARTPPANAYLDALAAAPARPRAARHLGRLGAVGRAAAWSDDDAPSSCAAAACP